MANDGDTLSEIKIGNVGGDFSGNVAGRDVNVDQSITGEALVPREKEEAADELKQLLASIQQQLAEVMAKQDALKEVSPAAPFVTQGVEQTINDSTEKVEADMSAESAQSVQENLKEATTLLTGILDGAKVTAEKIGEVGHAVKPIAEKLEPLIGSIGKALLLIKLWL